MGRNKIIQTPDNDFIGLGCVARWLTTSPSRNSHSEPGSMVTQSSLSVSGWVATTATRSFGVVTSLKHASPNEWLISWHKLSPGWHLGRQQPEAAASTWLLR